MQLDSNKVWPVNDVELFPENFLGLPSPDQGFFLAVEGQSTDDGKVFVNTFQDEEDVEYIGGVIKDYELDSVINKARTAMAMRGFKTQIAEDETEHGFMAWNLPDSKRFILFFGTQRSQMLTEKALEWIGECGLPYNEIIQGFGSFKNSKDSKTKSILKDLVEASKDKSFMLESKTQNVTSNSSQIDDIDIIDSNDIDMDIELDIDMDNESIPPIRGLKV